MHGSNDNAPTPATGVRSVTTPMYVVNSGAVGANPMWWQICPPVPRDVALEIMHHLTELTPVAFAPDGHRRLRVVAQPVSVER